MKAVEFEGKVNPDGQISVPVEVAGQLPSGGSLHIVLQWDKSDEDRA